MEIHETYKDNSVKNSTDILWKLYPYTLSTYKKIIILYLSLNISKLEERRLKKDIS